MTVEELKVIISAETNGFDKASKNTKKTVTKMDKTINSLHKKLQNAFNIRENNNNTLNKLSSQFERMQKTAQGVNGAVGAISGNLGDIGKTSISGIATDLVNARKQAEEFKKDFNNLKKFIVDSTAEMEQTDIFKADPKNFENSEIYKQYTQELTKKIQAFWDKHSGFFVEKLVTKGNNFDNFANIDYKSLDKWVADYTPEKDLEKSKQRVIEIQQRMKDFKFKDTGIKQMIKELTALEKKLEAVNKQRQKLLEPISNFMDVSKADPEVLRDAVSRLADVERQISDYQGKIIKLREKAIGKGWFDKKGVNFNTDALSATLDEDRAALEVYGRQIDTTKKRIKDLESYLKKTSYQANKTTKSVSKFGRALKMVKISAGFMILSKIFGAITKDLGECYNALMKFDNANKNILGYNTAISNLTSAFKRLSGEIAVTVAQLATALEPILTPIINFVTEFVTVLSKLFAALQGKDSVAVVNKDYWKNYADSLKDANKEQKRFLAGFDELTVLSENKTDTDNLEDLYKVEKLTGIFAEISKHNKKILAMLAAFGGIAGILKLINLLFGKKNSTLSKQTDLTNKESGAVKGLNANYGLLTAGALGLAAALGGILFPKPEGSEEWQPALQPAISAVGQLDEELQNVNNTARQTSPVLSTVQSSVRSLLSIPKISLNVALNLNPLNSGIGIAKHLYKAFGYALIQQQKANNTEMVKSQNSVLQQIKTNLGTWLTGLPIMFAQGWENIKNNVANGVSQTYANIASWCSATSQAIGITIGNWGQSVYNGLTYAGNAITSWGRGSYNALVSWGQGVSQLFAEVGNSIITSIGQALSNAWEGIKEVASAAGQKVKDFHKNYGKQIAITGAVISGALVLGAIALSAPTGGTSLAAIPALAALADGGVLTTPTPALVGEYAGAKSNPEIVSPQNIMRETVSEANMEVVNAIYAIGNQITKAVDDKDMDVYMDADKVTRQVTKRQDTIKRQQGTSLVTI